MNKKQRVTDATGTGTTEFVLSNDRVSVRLDRRFPRVLCHDDAGSGTRILGQVEAMLPRVYVYRRRDRTELTSDAPEVSVSYSSQVRPDEVIYTGSLQVEGAPAADFELLFRLKGAELLVRLQNVREHAGYLFLTVRLDRLATAASDEGDSRVVTGVYQGRVLDPAKCKPRMLDYSWCGFTARPCGAVYRPAFMVTVDTNLSGYEDLMVNDVSEYTRAGGARTLASLGVEMMYRQRNVTGKSQLKIAPPEHKARLVIPGVEPFLCAPEKDTRLHFIFAAKGKTLGWPDAARYFQSLLPAKAKCHPLYAGALVYKIVLAHFERPYMTFEQALDIIRQIHAVTGGMKQVCYLAYFQCRGGETGYPEMSSIYPPVGDKAMLRRVIREARKYNAVVSFHQNLDTFDAEADCVDGRYIARDCNGHLYDGLFWNPTQLLRISLPNYRPQVRRLIDRLVKDYGISQTYHLDQYSGSPYAFDANPARPLPGKAFTEGKLALLKDFNARGIDVTSENLTHPYVGHIGHSWALFNWHAYWEGEEVVPFAQFIYHHAASWNSSNAKTTESMLDSLIQGGGCALEWPMGEFLVDEARIDVVPTPWAPVLDALYLLQHPYLMLRGRKWTDVIAKGTVRRVVYGRRSYVEVDEAAKRYRVVVDGQTVAKDFVTVVPAPDGEGLIAYAREATVLNWRAPTAWKDGTLRAGTLTPSGPGIRLEATVKNGRIRINIPARTPVRLERA